MNALEPRVISLTAEQAEEANALLQVAAQNISHNEHEDALWKLWDLLALLLGIEAD